VNFNGEPVLVGRDCGGRDVRLDRDLVDAFTRATGDTNELYERYAPGLVLHSEGHRDPQWYLASTFGNLHARQEWELFHAIEMDTLVTTRAFIRDRYRKRGRDYVVKETWMLDAGGTLLCRGITHQSFLAEQPDRTDPSRDVVSKDREKAKKRASEMEGTGGRQLPTVTKTVSEEMCMAFSGPGENYHTNREAARALGFPDIVVQGMLPICFLSELLTREYGHGWLAGGKMDVRLVNVLWAGESVRACAEVTSEIPVAGARREFLDVWVEKEDGTKVVVGQAASPSAVT